MLVFPLMEGPSAMVSLRQAGYNYFIFAQCHDPPCPLVHTMPDMFTTSLISEYLDMVAIDTDAIDTDLHILYPKEEDIFR